MKNGEPTSAFPAMVARMPINAKMEQMAVKTPHRRMRMGRMVTYQRYSHSVESRPEERRGRGEGGEEIVERDCGVLENK